MTEVLKYTISPYQVTTASPTNSLPDNDFAQRYCDNRFGIGKWKYTQSGREAIRMALEVFGLGNSDLVTILTTSENFYISSCVTRTIEAVCQWNRELTAETKIIFVNHEFGYPYPDMEKLLATGLPIIEDCCTTFFSQDEFSKVGKYGDYATYSFPKFFDIASGGLLVANKSQITPPLLEESHIRYIENLVSPQLENENELLETRCINFETAAALFARLGFTQRFEKNDKIVPSVLMLKNNSIVKDLSQLKIYLAQRGIESSVFYGEDAFFIPNHQHFDHKDIDYMYEVLSDYLKKQN